MSDDMNPTNRHPQRTPVEQAMMWERMSGERLSHAQRAAVMRGEPFHPPPGGELTEVAVLERIVQTLVRGFLAVAVGIALAGLSISWAIGRLHP